MVRVILKRLSNLSVSCNLMTYDFSYTFTKGFPRELSLNWIDVNQTARKRESVLKDLDIINRRLHNMQINSSLLKSFWFSDVFHLWHHIAIYHNLTFHCWIMRSAIKQIIMCDAKWNCLHSDAKTLKWTLIAMKRIKHHSQT